MTARAQITLFLSTICAGVSVAQPSEFVGSAVCGACHPQQFSKWQRSPHARTGNRLAAAQIPLGACKSCHTTGAWPALSEPAVGCESCHGAGAGYRTKDIMQNSVLSKLLGLRDLSKSTDRQALCASCHWKSTKLLEFNSEAMWKKFGHGGGS